MKFQPIAGKMNGHDWFAKRCIMTNPAYIPSLNSRIRQFTTRLVIKNKKGRLHGT